MSLTIGETIQQLHLALRDYIEATYHVSHPLMVQQRQRLLDEPEVIHQLPYLESTPRYRPGTHFRDLGLDEAALEVFLSVAQASDGLDLLIHDPPYEHQARSVELSLVKGRSLVVVTGTGSGKTECFLLPILGKLAREARSTGERFRETPAVRAMVLYPMNALVNDQLGRFRVLLGDPRIVSRFMAWSGRPARFARYTSRTLYPGVRHEDKDKRRLRPIESYFVDALKTASGPSSPEQRAADRLVRELKKRGKWPGKPDLLRWYGKKGTRWRDKNQEFKRCVTLPADPELLTRHEVQAAPPDVLVTNYSMLEYMLMRPLERPIFDMTRDWLHACPDEKFLLVIDEAHLYRGAAGAEVALLIRRLRKRLEIPPERLQVICTSASFNDPNHAVRFGAQLTGKEPADFHRVTGKLLLREGAARGTQEDAVALDAIDLSAFYDARTNAERLSLVASFLNYREVATRESLQSSLYYALVSFAPMVKLINSTMERAWPVQALGKLLFDGVPPELAERAVTTLIALGSIARLSSREPGLLPCRVHSFYRGLAGLWVCMDSDCRSLPATERGGPAGRLFSQPRDSCECGARVLELYTCRNCGTAYGRAYTSDLDDPNFLWPEAGGALRTVAGQIDPLFPIDLLLERPVFKDEVEPAGYDLATGRLNPEQESTWRRQVYIRKRHQRRRGDDDEIISFQRGIFRPCAVCGEEASFGRSSVQDHQTKGDQPFQALIARQIQVQPPSPGAASKLAPLRGRKVLIFSDSRQTAARLAPNLQMYSMRDTLRPLIVAGYARLARARELSPNLSLEELYLSVLISAVEMGVRLRPELKPGESYQEEQIVADAAGRGALHDGASLLSLAWQMRGVRPPEALLLAIMRSLTDRYYGLESLALASLTERAGHTSQLHMLDDIPGYAETHEQKLALARTWLRGWLRRSLWLNHMPTVWWNLHVRPHSGNFKLVSRLIRDKNAKATFDKAWLPTLFRLFTERMAPGQFRLRGSELSLEIGGSWSYCRSCRTVQRPFPGRDTCIKCGQDTASAIDPNHESVFVARKGYYRRSTLEALRNPPRPPMAIIAAEHTAQLNSAQSDEVFSKAEEHELLFQDVDLGPDDRGRARPAIDVLSCTTTMEVGIDIGSLSGVSLRNMPPARANYQQRAGRAGRRGNAVATVTAFGSADSHDDHYFRHPDQMIRGPVEDPVLTLDNAEIARRHVTAYLLQRYHQARLPNIEPEEQPTLFAVLGTVQDFKNPQASISRVDFADWLRSNGAALRSDVSSWLPDELSASARSALLDGLVEETLGPIDSAIEWDVRTDADGVLANGVVNQRVDTDADVDTGLEVPEQEGEERVGRDPSAENLLDRLLYKGVLPRYAFPTDVATFYVFDSNDPSYFLPKFQYRPSQGLPVALSQYAPGKDVWIDGKLWTSGAIYSPIPSGRYAAWLARRLYYECDRCHYATTTDLKDGGMGEKKDCRACGGVGTLGPATNWLRPPGFAHPVGKLPGTSPDDQPARSYATRAKLTMDTPPSDACWTELNGNLRGYYARPHLLVTNRGPRQEGYTYCTQCGLIESTALSRGAVIAAHRKPFPNSRDPNCPGGRATKGLVLGTDFISDVFLVSIKVTAPLTLRPGVLATDVVLRTICEAVVKAACKRLELEASELQAEYRPALTPAGRDGLEAEIFLYDTLPGGAGFAQRVGQLGLAVFHEALEILEDCRDECDRSCYRCLRSYKNKFEHDLLDRHVGSSLLRFLLTGQAPSVPPERLRRSTDLLYNDLKRQGISGLLLERDRVVPGRGSGAGAVAPILVTTRSGGQLAIGLHGPLTPNEPPNDDFRRFMEPSSPVRGLLEDELVVRRNLPSVTDKIIKEIA